MIAIHGYRTRSRHSFLDIAHHRLAQNTWASVWRAKEGALPVVADRKCVEAAELVLPTDKSLRPDWLAGPYARLTRGSFVQPPHENFLRNKPWVCTKLPSVGGRRSAVVERVGADPSNARLLSRSGTVASWHCYNRYRDTEIHVGSITRY